MKEMKEEIAKARLNPSHSRIEKSQDFLELTQVPTKSVEATTVDQTEIIKEMEKRFTEAINT